MSRGPPRRPRNPVARAVRTPQYRMRITEDKRRKVREDPGREDPGREDRVHEDPGREDRSREDPGREDRVREAVRKLPKPDKPDDA